MAANAPTAAELMRSSLRDPRTRELAITKFMTWAFTVCAVVALGLLPVLGWKLSASLATVLALAAVFYRAQSLAMLRGRFHPALQRINVTVEVSAPAALFVADLLTRDPVFALTTPPAIAWSALIMLSGLRANRPLAIYAGTLAAVEYGVAYATLAYPNLPPDAAVTLQPTLVAVRCALLFGSGLLTSFVTSQFMKHAEAAFRTVRERELSGKYVLHERVGSGGMAEVFRATYCPEGGFEKLVAVKRVLPAYCEDENFVRMFRREAEVGSRLSHPNIVQVLDLGRERGTYFLAMEYVDGCSLSSLLRTPSNAQLPVSTVIYIGAEVANALDYLHAKTGTDGEHLRLVHRDVNPPNILLSATGEVKLTDFGIARAADGVALSESGLVRGKAGYMAPEQIRGDVLDGRTDLFGLGVSLYEALSGEKCFQGPDTQAILRDTKKRELPPISSLRPDVPPELDAILRDLLVKDPLNRISSAASLRSRLLALGNGFSPLEARGRLAELISRARMPIADPPTPTVESLSQPGSHLKHVG